MAKKIPYRTYLPEEKIPKYWYNLRADMKNKPEPLLNPATLKPVTAEELYPVFTKASVQQELDNDTRYFEIPEPVRELYKVYRPSPLIRAYNLEKYLNTPAKIYYKFEGNNTSGSHKLNSAIAQAYYAKAEGLSGLTHRDRRRTCGGLRFPKPARISGCRSRCIWLRCLITKNPSENRYAGFRQQRYRFPEQYDAGRQNAA
jgi:hypothetical protein